MSIASELAGLRKRVAELERRLENSYRHGPVTDVDAEKQLARLAIGKGPDGTVQKSPWLPYGQFAGKLKVHTPPTVGQNMTMMAPGGSLEAAVVLPFTWNEEHDSPSQSEDENVVVYGGIKFTLTDGVLRIEAGGFTLKISSGGLHMAGGKIGHDGKDIGSDHKHLDVVPGPGVTGLPTPGAPTP